MDVEQIKAENVALRDTILSLIEEYQKNTGTQPVIEIDWSTSISGPARPVVSVWSWVR